VIYAVVIWGCSRWTVVPPASDPGDAAALALEGLTPQNRNDRTRLIRDFLTTAPERASSLGSSPPTSPVVDTRVGIRALLGNIEGEGPDSGMAARSHAATRGASLMDRRERGSRGERVGGRFGPRGDSRGVNSGRGRASSPRDLDLAVVPSRVLRILLFVTGSLVGLSLAGQAMVYYLPDFPVRDASAKFFYVDFEQSLPTLYSSVLFLVGALLFGLIAFGHARGHRAFVRHWVALSLVCVLLALDEFASMHERMTVLFRELLDIRGGLLFWYTWVIPGAALVAVLTAAFLPFLRHLPRPTRRGLWGAGILFLTGAIGLELVGGSFAAVHGKLNMSFVLIVTVEEAFEMLGLAVLVHTLLAYIPVGLPMARWRVRVVAPVP